MTPESPDAGPERQRRDESGSPEDSPQDRVPRESPAQPKSVKRVEQADYRSGARQGFNNYKLRFRTQQTSDASDPDETEDDSGS